MKKLSIISLVIVLTIYLSLTKPLSAKDKSEKIPHRVPRVISVVKVDGVLDDEVWSQALMLELNYEVRPGENVPPPVRTEVLLAYSESHFYAAFRAYDPEPSKIRAIISDRDRMYGDDWVVLVMDTFNDQRRTYDFFCNPLGVQGDMIETPEGNEGSGWDAIWDSDGRITENGYVVEMAIPFSSLRFQRSEGDQIWSFDAVRSYPRNVRHHIGLFPRDRNNNCYMCQSEKLIGFAGATPGKNIEFDPTLYSVMTQERENFPGGKFVEREKELDPGFTARWGFTPNLNLNATINPDFSNVEADVAQLDINTQFALYYPEKRPFFLEGASIFGTMLQAVYTRTLADPDWGVKLTGKEGSHAIGFFSVRDNMTNLIFPASQGSESTSLSNNSMGNVLRYRRDVGRASNFGVLITDREGDQYYNRVGGFDGTYKFTQKDAVYFQVLGSQTKYPDAVKTDFSQPDKKFSGTAGSFYYNHNTRNLDWYAEYLDLSENFRADLGFIPQVGYRRGEVGADYSWIGSNEKWYSQISWGANWDKTMEQSGALIEEEIETYLEYDGPLQLECVINFGARDRVYNGAKFYQNYGFAYLEMNPSGIFSYGLGGYLRDQIDYSHTRAGKLIGFDPYFELRLGRHVVIDVDHNFQRMKVKGERLYTANVSNFKIVYQFTKRMFLRSILQYVDYNRNLNLYDFDVETNTKRLFTQLLFSYKINPQTVLFLGYSDNHFGDENTDITQTDRTFFTKIGYAWVL